MGKALNIIANVAVAVAATAIFGPPGGFTVLGTQIGMGASIALAAFGSLALSALGQALQPKAKLPNLASFEQQVSARTAMIRQSITARRLPFGEVILSGPLTFYEATANNGFHHLVITLGDAPATGWASIGIVWVDNEPIFESQIDGSGNVTAGKYANKLRIKKHLGGPDQVADADLIAEIDYLDANFRGRGVAYLYLRVDWDQDTFPNGLPNDVRAIARTNTVLDSRDATRRYLPSPPLALVEYGTEKTVGLGYPSDRFPSAYVNAAANVCEEIVDARPVGHAVVDVDVANNLLELATAGSGAPIRFQTGDRAMLQSTGTEPGGTNDATEYYVRVERLVGAPFENGTTIALSAGDYTGDVAKAITGYGAPAVSAVDATHKTGIIRPAVSLHTAYAGAIAGTGVVDLTSAGTGQVVIVKNGEPRYECAGVLETDRTPRDNILDLLKSMAGDLVSAGLAFQVYAGTFRTPGPIFDEDDLMGPIVVRTRHSRMSRFNSVKGIFATHLTVGEATDYPPVIDLTYVAADLAGAVSPVTESDAVFIDVDQPFTSRAAMAQRLGKIILARHRREITVEYPTTLRGRLVLPGSIVRITNVRRGWDEKTFEVINLETMMFGAGEAQVRGVKMYLAELDATVFTFDPDSDETVKAPRALPPGGNPLNIAAPTGLSVESGTDALYRKGDGTIVSRIKATWTAAADGWVTEHLMRFKRSADPATAWQWNPPVRVPIVQDYAWDVEDDVAYDVEVYARNVLGKLSDPVAVANHIVIGKTAAPSNITSLTAQQIGNVVTFSWPPIADTDLDGYSLRYMAAPFAWDSARTISRETKGTLITNTALPPGAWVVGIKAIDTSDNYSAAATTTSITVTTANTGITSLTEHPRWPGILDGLVRHDTSGTLIPRSTVLAADMTDAQLWDTFVHSPVSSPAYESGEIDLEFDAAEVRIYGTVAVTLGPNEAGTPSGDLQIDYRDSDPDVYDGFEAWPSAANADFRYLKGRVQLDTSDGVEHLDGFTLSTDKGQRTEQATGVAIAGGGTIITFAERFHSVPAITVTPQSGSALQATAASPVVTGFTAHIFNSAGTDVGGTLQSWTATGV